MNKYIRLTMISAILGLTFFIPLSYASDTAPLKGEFQLASLAFHSYEGVCCGKVGCCGSGECIAPVKVKHVHHKHHRKHHHKQKHKHHKKPKKSCEKPKKSCGCLYS